MTAQPMVRNNPTANRYEITIDDALAGFAVYYLDGDTIVFVHTEVDPTIAGNGLGSTLAHHALDDVRRRGLRVVALCPFIGAYIRRHPAYQDLVAEPAHRRAVLRDLS